MDETKRTVRKTIASGVISAQRHDTTAVEYACGRLDWVTKNDLPIGTKIDLVAHVPVERKLIRPKDARWLIDDRGNPLRTYLDVGGRIVAEAWQNGNTFVYAVKRIGDGDPFDYISLAQDAAEHELADQGKCGFGWEDDVPEFIAYQVESITAAGHYYPWNSVEFEEALSIFNDRSCDGEPWRFLRLSGITYEGEHVDITPEQKDGE